MNLEQIEIAIANLTLELEDLKIDRRLAVANKVKDFDLTEVNAKIASGWFLRRDTESGFLIRRVFEVNKDRENFEVRLNTIEIEDMGWRTDISQENNHRLYVDNLNFENYEEISQELFDTLTNYISKIKNS